MGKIIPGSQAGESKRMRRTTTASLRRAVSTGRSYTQETGRSVHPGPLYALDVF